MTKILIVRDMNAASNTEGRYFVIEDAMQAQDVALKLLNEWRAVGLLEGKAKVFAETACDAVDGDLAWGLLSRLRDVEVITPEFVR